MSGPTPRARALIEALHEPTSNEARWEIAQKFLDEERDEAIAEAIPPGTIIGRHSCPPMERVAYNTFGTEAVAPTEGE